MLRFFVAFALGTHVLGQGFPKACPPVRVRGVNDTIGTCPQDYPIVGKTLEPVHESHDPPTGLAVDREHNIYLTYPRNNGPVNVTLTIATGFDTEEAWPNAWIQNCQKNEDRTFCFINVQNAVLDAEGRLWVLDSGIPPGEREPVPSGAKLMAFNVTNKSLVKSYPIPEGLYYGHLNLNDVRINNTLGVDGFAFMTEIGSGSSLLAMDLASGQVERRLFNTSFVRWDEKYVGSYNGELIYAWNDTQKDHLKIGADGIALASGNVYWGVLSSRRYYYIPQEILANFTMTDEEVLEHVVFPGQLSSEQAGFTADDKGRVYMLASEQNAIVYFDTQQSEVKEEINGVSPGGTGLIHPENYVVKTLVKSALIQHADSAAVLDGYLYFNTNQLHLRPMSQYGNVDRRKGPFRSYRTYIGTGPAL